MKHSMQSKQSTNPEIFTKCSAGSELPLIPFTTFPKKSQPIYEHKRLTRNVQNDEIVRDFCLSAAEHKLLDPLITRTKSLSQAL